MWFSRRRREHDDQSHEKMWCLASFFLVFFFFFWVLAIPKFSWRSLVRILVLVWRRSRSANWRVCYRELDNFSSKWRFVNGWENVESGKHEKRASVCFAYVWHTWQEGRGMLSETKTHFCFFCWVWFISLAEMLFNPN